MSADFVIIERQDLTVHLSDESPSAVNPLTITFDAPGIKTEEESVLTYVVIPTGENAEDDVLYHIVINGHPFVKRLLDGEDKALQEVINANFLQPSGNEFTLRILQGSSVRLRDTCLFYKV